MLKGFLCSDAKKLDEDKRRVSFEQCLKCAETCENGCNFTAPFIQAFSNMGERTHISVTSSIGCLRNTYLSRTEDYYADPEGLYFLYRGQLAHKVLEDNPEKDSICEIEFVRSFKMPNGDEYTIQGRPDVIIPSKALIRDYKTTKAVPSYRQTKPYTNHIQQLNIYKWLVAGQTVIDDDGNQHKLPCKAVFNGVEQEVPAFGAIKKLQVIYMDMAHVKTTDSPVYDDSEAEQFLMDKVPVLKNALDNGVVPPKEDSWQCNGYCNMKSSCDKHYMEELKAQWTAEQKEQK